MSAPDTAAVPTTGAVTGWTTPEQTAVVDLLRGLAEADPTFSAQVCAYAGDRPIVDLRTGPALAEDSLICVFSVSKGLSAICIGMLVERGLLDPEEPVARYWPEFAAAGKERVTVGTLLSHRAGLIDVDGGLGWDELLDDARAAARLAAQRPFWRPDSGWAYHPLTMGVFMSELCRRVTGESLQAFYEREVRAPRGIDFFLGLPAELEPRAARVRVPEVPGIRVRAPQLLHLLGRQVTDLGFDALANSREAHAAGMPAAGGMASARGIARLYAAVGSDLGGGRLLSDETIALMGQIRSHGTDVVTGVTPGRFGLVFQKPGPERPFASHRAIGHDGAAGALGFFDPEDGLAFGYVTDTPAPAGGDLRADALAAAIRDALP